MSEYIDRQINGSGLFFFKSELSISKCAEIIGWYNDLTDKEKEYIDILRQEAKDEAEFFNQPNE